MKPNDMIIRLSTMKSLHMESIRKLKEIAKHQEAIRKLEMEIYDIEHSFDENFHSICKELRSKNNEDND